MTFLNPWAWLGLTALAAPVVAHLLARRAARRQLFPTLRFLPVSVLKPVRRDRTSDVPLLMLRCLVVALAVAALAQPVWRATPAQDLQPPIVRAIIVDTSASMRRPAAGGTAAADEARRMAGALGNESTGARVVETGTPARAIDAAVNWLAQQIGRRSIVVISDFQPSALSRADVDRIPGEIGIQLMPVTIDQQYVGRGFSLGGTGTPLTLLAGHHEQLGATAARTAAIETGSRPDQLARSVAIVFPGYENRAELLKSSAPIDEPWMFDLLRGIVEDPTVRVAFSELGQRPAEGVTAAQDSVDGRKQLMLATTAPSHSVASAALIAAVSRLCSSAVSPEEADSALRSSTELRAWSRDPSAASSQPRPADDESQGRYLWMAVIALLILEQLVRRRARTALEAEVTRAA